MRVGPAIVWNSWNPTRSQRILIVWIGAQTSIQLFVSTQFVVVEFYTQAGGSRYRDVAIPLFEFATDYYVVS